MSDMTSITPTKVFIACAAAVPSQNLADMPINARPNTSFATENASVVLTTLQSVVCTGVVRIKPKRHSKSRIAARMKDKPRCVSRQPKSGVCEEAFR